MSRSLLTVILYSAAWTEDARAANETPSKAARAMLPTQLRMMSSLKILAVCLLDIFVRTAGKGAGIFSVLLLCEEVASAAACTSPRLRGEGEESASLVQRKHEQKARVFEVVVFHRMQM